ncbi:MAG TPA: response regulator [Gemmata sp.]|nr:response regulator [Gemmata sp.]
MKHLVMIAESDDELRFLYQRFLANLGYEVDTAANGLECLAKLRQLKPDLIVVDRHLRWGGGDGVIAWLRDERATPPVPVILTEVISAPSDGAELIKTPVVGYLAKPFGLSAFLKRVRLALAGPTAGMDSSANGRIEVIRT